MDESEMSQQKPSVPDPGTPMNAMSRRSRRRFVTGAAAVTGGVFAATYVKPTLQSLGVSNALAANSGGGGLVLTTIEEFPTPTTVATATVTATAVNTETATPTKTETP